MRKIFLAVIAFFTVISPIGISSVRAQTPPHVFVGEATLDGVKAPDGTIIRALADGEPIPEAETTVQNGSFTLLVAQPRGTGLNGKMINFAVGDFIANQSYMWAIGGATILELTASSALPAVPLAIGPSVPDKALRGDPVTVTLTADTGLYKIAGGEVQVSFSPQVFSVDLQRTSAPEGRQQGASTEQGLYKVNWTYHSPTRTAATSGELVNIPLLVKESAPIGNASIYFYVTLFGVNGETFQVEPADLSFEINIVGAVGDFNGDDNVDFLDLAALGVVWGKKAGQPGFSTLFDLDNDGVVGASDLVILNQNYKTGRGAGEH